MYDQIVTKMRARHGLKAAESVGIAGLTCKETMTSDTERDVEVVMTAADTDMDDEVVLTGGADTTYFMSMGQKKVFIDHRYDMSSNVGVVRWINPFPNAQNPTALKARVHLYKNLKDPMTDDLLERIKQGGMGLSIGFIPTEITMPTVDERKMYPNAERIIRKWKMLEVSFTALPCNVKCQTSMCGDIPTPKTVTITPEPKIIRL